MTGLGHFCYSVLRTVGPPEAGVYGELVWEAEGAGPEPTVDEGSVAGGGRQGGGRGAGEEVEVRAAKKQNLRGTGGNCPGNPGTCALHPLPPLEFSREMETPSPLPGLLPPFPACPSPPALCFLGESRVPGSDSGPGCLWGSLSHFLPALWSSMPSLSPELLGAV